MEFCNGFKAIFFGKGGYKVTSKVKQKKKIAIVYVLPHLLLLGINLYAIIWRYTVDGAFTPFIAINTIWAVLMLFWFVPVLQKAFHFYPTSIALVASSKISKPIIKMRSSFNFKFFS